MDKTINGMQIRTLKTMGSAFDRGHLIIAVGEDGTEYIISTNELNKLLTSKVVFYKRLKRTRVHLTVDETLTTV